MAIVRLEGLGKLINPMNSYGNRTHYVLACSIMPQPDTLPHVPIYFAVLW
jgi:hypothetical protein